MALENVNRFISPTSTSGNSNWSIDDLHTLASQRLPDLVTERNDLILRADANSLWLRWFIEGFCSPFRYVNDPTKGEAHIYVDTKQRIDELFIHDTAPKKKAFAEKIAKHVLEEVIRQRNLNRERPSKKVKQDLLAASSTPRCWMCGYAFSLEAVAAFLKPSGAAPLQLPQLVDILRPRGLIERDISIEVEHITPVASGGGGESNLALACGWCNRHKGPKTSIYDASFRAPRSPYNLGRQTLYELPHPFWTIRLIAVRRICEHPDGCDASADSHEMFIAPVSCLGSPNPSNLQIFCSAHDPYRLDRFVNRTDAEVTWRDRKS